MVADSPAPVTDREDNIRFHDFRTHKSCQYCGEPVNWMYTRFGNKMPFNADLTPRSQDVGKAGWVPGLWLVKGSTSSIKRLVMAPALHYGREKLLRITHVALVHECPARLAARAMGLTGEVGA